MKELFQNEFEELVSHPDILILVTRDLSGHRIEWLVEINSLIGITGQTVLLICEDATRLKNEMSLSLSRTFYYETKDVLKFVKSFFGTKSIKKLVFWDADDKLFELFSSKLNARILIMRPYITEFRIKSFLAYLGKFLFLVHFKYIKKWEIGLLSIPRSNPFFLKKNWVDDKLILTEKSPNGIKNSNLQEKIRITIPGYISERKNPLVAISACSILRERYGIPIQLKFSGKIEPKVNSAIKSLDLAWVQINDLYMPRAKYIESLLDSDLVLLPYANRGSSGVVLESLALGLPVAIYRNRHWQNLSRYTRGQLLLMRKGEKGISKCILNYLARDSDCRVFEGLTKRKSAIDFLVSG